MDERHGRSRFRALIGETLGFAPDRVTLFGKGRVALYAILRALDIGRGDEVIVPAFTCVAVPNAILYAGAGPVWVDIDPATYTIDPAAVENAISSRTRAVLAQNTFGLSAELDAIMAIAERHHLTVVDDCTHLGFHDRLGEEADAFPQDVDLALGAHLAQGLEQGHALLGHRGAPPCRRFLLQRGEDDAVAALVHGPAVTPVWGHDLVVTLPGAIPYPSGRLRGLNRARSLDTPQRDAPGRPRAFDGAAGDTISALAVVKWKGRSANPNPQAIGWFGANRGLRLS